MKVCKQCGSLLTYGVIAIALLVSILAAFLPSEQVHALAYVSRFFEIMIPFLAVGALIQYLTCQRLGKLPAYSFIGLALPLRFLPIYCRVNICICSHTSVIFLK